MSEQTNFNETCFLFIKDANSDIQKRFFDINHLIHTANKKTNTIINIKYEEMIDCFCQNDMKCFIQCTKKLTQIYIENEIPYITISNELSYLKNILIELFLDNYQYNEIKILNQLFLKIEDIVAKLFLDIYIISLKSVCNLRLASINDMVDYHVVEHYASHLEWLINLAHSIQKNNTENFPQTNETLCKFGKWLLQDAKLIVKNNSKLKELDKIHSQLHQVAFQIKKLLSQEDEFHHNILLSYLEKSELLSLSIGTELALIDNTIINQKAVKDTLTASLGRQVLNQIFQNQYDIALATSTKYTMALCDLDYFKNVNDNYGHIAGDKMLQNFVQIVKKNLRNSDIIIRYGGEEFIIILPAVESKIAFNVLNKIRHEFENFILEYEGKQISTTVSMGLYEIAPKEKYNPMILEESIKCADYKLYQAKNNGRNQIVK